MTNKERLARMSAAMRGIQSFEERRMPRDIPEISRTSASGESFSVRPHHRSISFPDLRISLGASTVAQHLNGSQASRQPSAQIQSGSSSVYSSYAPLHGSTDFLPPQSHRRMASEQSHLAKEPLTQGSSLQGLNYGSENSDIGTHSNYSAESQVPEPLNVAPRSTQTTSTRRVGASSKVRQLWRPVLSPQPSMDPPEQDSPIGPHPAVRPPTRETATREAPMQEVSSRMIEDATTHHIQISTPLSRLPPSHSLTEDVHLLVPEHNGHLASTIVPHFPWLQVLSCFLVFCGVGGLMLSYGALLAYFATVRFPQSSPALLVLIGTTQPFLVFALAPLSIPTLSAVRFRWTFLCGAGIAAAGLMLTNLCTQGWHAFLTQGFAGIGMSIVYKCTMESISVYARSKFTRLVLGFSISGCAVGGIAVVLMIRSIGTASDLHQLTMIVLGLFAIIVFLPAVWMLPPCSPHRFQRRDTARGFRSLISLRQVQFWLVVAGSYLSASAMLIPFYMSVVYAIKQNLTGAEACFHLVAMIATAIPGLVLPSFIAHATPGYCTTLDVYALSTTWSTIVVFASLVATTNLAVVGFGALYSLAASPLSGLDLQLISRFPLRVPRFCLPLVGLYAQITTNQRNGASSDLNLTPSSNRTQEIALHPLKHTITGWARALGFLTGPALGALLLKRNESDIWDGFKELQIYTGSMLASSAVSFFLARVLSDVRFASAVNRGQNVLPSGTTDTEP